MPTDDAQRGQELERWRPYLLVVARMYLPVHLRKRIDPEDAVHDTYRKAIENWEQCNRSLKAWLRKILLRHIQDLIARESAQNRDINLEKDIEFSSCRLDAMLVADHTSPSEKAERNEEDTRLAEALARLPTHQQTVVILHRIHGMKLVEVAAHLNVSLGVVAGRLKEGVATLRRVLGSGESTP